MFRFVTSAVLLFTLAACTVSTQDSGFKFGQEDTYGLVALKHPEMTAESIIYLQAVDLDSKTFTGDPLPFRVCSICIPPKNTYHFEDGDVRKFHFLPVPPGKYALVELFTSEFSLFSRLEKIHRCYSQGTAVFEVKAGEISVLPLTMNKSSQARSISEVNGIISLYPGIKTKAVPATPLAIVAFSTKKGCLREIDGRPLIILKKFNKGITAEIQRDEYDVSGRQVTVVLD